MKILIACKEFPHAKVIGGPIIIYNRLKYLSCNHQVSLTAFYKEEERIFIPSVEGYCHDLKLIPLPVSRSALKAASDFFFSPVPHYFLRVHASQAMARNIGAMVEKDKYDFVIAEYSVMGQFLHHNPWLPPTRRVMSVHECYYLARLKDFRHHGWGLRKLREAINLKGLKTYEFEMYRQADKVLTLTPQGKDELLEVSPDLDIAVVPHGVDIEKFAFTPDGGEKNTLVFVGNYLHYPNADAMLHFLADIWPRLRERVPDVKITIVGQGPPPELQAYSQQAGIEVTGRVDDVVPYLKKGRIFICPVRLGGGFRGKILEAMSVGRPIVSTALGAEGIPARDGENILLADLAEEFAGKIHALLSDKALYEKISLSGRRLVEERFAWEKGVEVLEGVLEKMMAAPPREHKQ